MQPNQWGIFHVVPRFHYTLKSVLIPRSLDAQKVVMDGRFLANGAFAYLAIRPFFEHKIPRVEKPRRNTSH